MRLIGLLGPARCRPHIDAARCRGAGGESTDRRRLVVGASNSETFWRIFRDELRELGYVEVFRSYGADPECGEGPSLRGTAILDFDSFTVRIFGKSASDAGAPRRRAVMLNGEMLGLETAARAIAKASG
jgi:hypothetical protein